MNIKELPVDDADKAWFKRLEDEAFAAHLARVEAQKKATPKYPKRDPKRRRGAYHASRFKPTRNRVHVARRPNAERYKYAHTQIT
jgi:hypothetical protein